MSFVSCDGDSLLLHCHIQPKASRDAIAGIHGGRLKIQVASPPVDGQANKQLVKFMARCLGVPKSRIEIVRGASGRLKTLKINGMDALPGNFPFQP